MTAEITEENIGRWSDETGRQIDPEIMKAVLLFNKTGYTTNYSCAGHEQPGSRIDVTVEGAPGYSMAMLKAAAKRFNAQRSSTGRLKIRVTDFADLEPLDPEDRAEHPLPEGGLAQINVQPFYYQDIGDPPPPTPTHKELVEGRKMMEEFAKFLLDRPSGIAGAATKTRRTTKRRTREVVPSALRGVR